MVVLPSEHHLAALKAISPGNLVGEVLLLFVVIGIDAALHPKRHMNSYLRRGGEMLTDLNSVGVQLSGLGFCT
jgi:hypothetical protein